MTAYLRSTAMPDTSTGAVDRDMRTFARDPGLARPDLEGCHFDA